MKNVFMVKFDWSTDDTENVEIELYRNYYDAVTRFHEIIENEKNPELSWIGTNAFDEQGNVREGYELDYMFTDADGSYQYWSVTDRNNYYFHSFVSIEEIEIK